VVKNATGTANSRTNVFRMKFVKRQPAGVDISDVTAFAEFVIDLQGRFADYCRLGNGIGTLSNENSGTRRHRVR